MKRDYIKTINQFNRLFVALLLVYFFVAGLVLPFVI